jgi:hypothetical protein
MERLLCVSLALAIGTGALLADEVKGTFKKINGDKITITVDNADKTYPLAQDPLVVTDDNKAKAVKGGLKAVKEGTAVTVITEKKDDKETVITVKVKAGKKK